MVSVAEQLPDLDVHRSQGTPLPNLQAEANQRNVLWDGEDMTIDDACDVSFESEDMKQASKAQRKPVAKVDQDTGSILPWSSQVAAEYMGRKKIGDMPLTFDDEDASSFETGNGKATEPDLTRYGTIIYELPPDKPRDEVATQLLTESEQIRLAAVISQ